MCGSSEGLVMDNLLFFMMSASKGAQTYLELAKEVIANEQKRLGRGIHALIPQVDDTPLSDAIDVETEKFKLTPTNRAKNLMKTVWQSLLVPWNSTASCNL